MSRTRESATVFSAVLRPHRNATLGGLYVGLTLMAIAIAGVGVAFIAIGAWPVFSFLGLEFALLFGALRWNHHAGQMFESIDLTERSLTVERVNPWGRRRSWSFQPHWMQVNVDDPPRPESRLELRSHGRALVIGAFLTPEERLEVAEALRTSLARLTLQGTRAPTS